ncbi:MAG: TonB family protein [Flavobacteriales bacterium]|jgi:TonB family protein
MKIIIFYILFFLLFSTNLVAQSSLCKHEEEEELGNGVVESMPQIKRGDESLLKFIHKQIMYDSILKIDCEQIVHVFFWVDENGNTLSHCLLKEVREDLDKEALRVAKLVKFDEPAKHRGKPIKIKYVIPVKFEPKKSRQ